MSFEIKNINQCIEFLEYVSKKKESYFADDDGKIKTISRGEFNKLIEKQQVATYENLEAIISKISDKDSKQHTETLNKIRAIRNELFLYLNPTSDDSDKKLGSLSKDALGIILSHTSPKDVEATRLLNNKFYSAVTRRTQILSINNGQLNLKKALPPTCETAKQAIEWLTKDENACTFLTYADFRGFEDFNEDDLKKLTESFPNIHHLSIKSNIIKKIDNLPTLLQTLNCGGCLELESLPKKLPDSLQTLNCRCCYKLKSLPEKLPAKLQTLDCGECWKLESLPKKLPDSLQTLNCGGCRQFESLPVLPDSLQTLNCGGCRQFESLPELPALLQILDCNRCKKLEHLPELPALLQTLKCTSCDKLEYLPELPASLQTLDCRVCRKLKLPENIPEGCKVLK